MRAPKIKGAVWQLLKKTATTKVDFEILSID
jgi:hypothetical protein